MRVLRSSMSLGLVPLWCLIAVASCAAPARHVPPAAARPIAIATTRAVYVSPDAFDFRAILPGPPADDSAEHRAEVDKMLSLQADRTPEDVQRCRNEEEVTVFAFSTVLGSRFNANELPVTASLMQDVYVQARSVSNAAKKVWIRTRPPLADRRIKPCVKLEKSPSYPSGHAVRGMVWAMLLAEIFPEQREALMARGRQVGDDRFLAGMHYPTDVAGGQTLGAEIAKRMLENPDFRAELERARAECVKIKSGHRSTQPA